MRTTIDIVKNSGQTVNVPAEVFKHAPGLAVRKETVGKSWNVTHVKSGNAVKTFNTRKQAKEFLDRVADLTDWELPKFKLLASLKGKMTTLQDVYNDIMLR